MPPKSATDNVRKICNCVKWKTCKHPWYLDEQRDGVRYRDNLDKLLDRHADTFQEAKDEARRAIQAKVDGRDPRGLLPADDPTLAELLARFDSEKPRSDRWQIGKILKTEVRSATGPRAFGKWRLSAIATETLQEFRRLRPLVAGNRDLKLLSAAFNFAALRGLVAKSPFRIGDVNAVKQGREEGRTRRLQHGEAERLMAHARSLGDIITGALETGCRKGELLSMQWHQVRFAPRAEIFLPAQKTKAKKDRRVPISSELRHVLERRRLDPAGDPIPSDGFVFGDEIGRPRGSIKSAWRFLCQRAGITQLHFHDLRREAGSRWMDAGVPLGTIQRWLGHHNISQTSTYLGASHGGDEQDMRAFESKVGRPPVLESEGRESGPGSELTDIDRPARQEGRIEAKSDRPKRRIPNKNREERRADPTIH